MTKKEEIKNNKVRQSTALIHLYTLCGGGKLTANQIVWRLHRIEEAATQSAERYAQGKIQTTNWNNLSELYEKHVQKIFNNQLQGLKINADPRGYAIKIERDEMSTIYKEVDLHKDWGGYGILVPDFK